MRLSVWAPEGAPEITEGDDLAEILVGLLGPDANADEALADGDIVVVTSKAVAKAEGRVRPGSREAAVSEETVRVVARRGSVTIARTRHGLTMAAAGVDASNVAAGHVVLLPLDPDESARVLRRRLHDLTGRAVGVVVTDTVGRAWREGQTDIAVGASGLQVLEDFAGRTDPHGNPLVVTAPAVADEIAGAAELAQGKLGGRPFAVVRGRPDLVLDVDDDGPGAVALVRPDDADMFGWGSREAVLRALEGNAVDAAPFGGPASPAELVETLREALRVDARVAGTTVRVAVDSPRLAWAVGVAAYAHGWESTTDDAGDVVDLRSRPALT